MLLPNKSRLMNFTRKHIAPQYLGIIDIGSYKIRVSACKFLNKQVTILWYTEKRQNTSTFINGECRDLATLCEDIDDTIKKLESENTIILERVVINFPFWELFVATKKINYRRSLPHTPIDKVELEKIITRAQEISLKKLSSEIYETHAIGREETELILSRINSFKIDGTLHELVIGKSGENIKISVFNVFAPLSKHNLVHHIGNIVEKKIMRTLPSEFCLIKLFEQESIIVINLGATQTSISIKIDNELLGITKVSIGINDLLTSIARNTKEARNQILEKLDTSEYLQEKQSFLDIWSSAVMLWIKEIVGQEICPNTLALFGGGGNNTFIKNTLKHLDFESSGISIVKQELNFCSVDIESLMEHISPESHDLVKDINLDSLGLILETNSILSREKDSISQSLKKVVMHLWYTNQ